MNRSLQLLTGLAVAASLVAGADRLRIKPAKAYHDSKDVPSVYSLPPPQYLERLCLRYNDALVSLLWADLLFQYGDFVQKHRRQSWTTAYVDTMVYLDPTFRTPYKYLAAFLTLQSVDPSDADYRDGYRLFKRGTEMLPNDPDVWGEFAAFLVFDYAPRTDGEVKKQLLIEGARAGSRATELGYHMDNIGLVSANILGNSGEIQLAIEQLQRAYVLAPDDDSRAMVIARLRKYQAESAIDRQKRQLSHDKCLRQSQGRLSSSEFLVFGPVRNVAHCLDAPPESPECAEPAWETPCEINQAPEK
jgi:tetratricopeptide (TPR) repeat protein